MTLSIDDVKPDEQKEATVEWKDDEATFVYKTGLTLGDYGRIERKHTNKKTGELESEKYVVDILSELIVDSSFDEPISVVLEAADGKFSYKILDELDFELPNGQENLNQN